MKLSKVLVVCVIMMVIISACTRDEASVFTCQPCSASTISFSKEIIPIFHTSCAVSGCHTGPAASAPGQVSLDSAVAYTQATHPGKGYVNTGDPNSSLLYSELLAGSFNHMPVGGQLDACSIQKIFCWIQQGGLNN